MITALTTTRKHPSPPSSWLPSSPFSPLLSLWLSSSTAARSIRDSRLHKITLSQRYEEDEITQSKTYVPYGKKNSNQVNIPQNSLGGSITELQPQMVMVQPVVGYGQQLPMNGMFQIPIYVMANPSPPPLPKE